MNLFFCLQFLQRVFSMDTLVKPLPPAMAYYASRNLNFFTRIFTQFFGKHAYCTFWPLNKGLLSGSIYKLSLYVLVSYTRRITCSLLCFLDKILCFICNFILPPSTPRRNPENNDNNYIHIRSSLFFFFLLHTMYLVHSSLLLPKKEKQNKYG